eukprot:760747-Hanusia_phi.AAC.5
MLRIAAVSESVAEDGAARTTTGQQEAGQGAKSSQGRGEEHCRASRQTCKEQRASCYSLRAHGLSQEQEAEDGGVDLTDASKETSPASSNPRGPHRIHSVDDCGALGIYALLPDRLLRCEQTQKAERHMSYLSPARSWSRLW